MNDKKTPSLDKLFELGDLDNFLDWDTVRMLHEQRHEEVSSEEGTERRSAVCGWECQMENLVEAIEESARRRGVRREDVLTALLAYLHRDDPLL